MRSTDGILQGRFQQRTAGTDLHYDASDLWPFEPRWPVQKGNFSGDGTVQM